MLEENSPPAASFMGLGEAKNEVVDVEIGPSEPLNTRGGARIDFKDLHSTIALKKGKSKTILNGISAYVRPGKLTALMGPSGSGKTSLLNVLAGRTRHVKGMHLQGAIQLNGQRVTNWDGYRSLCAYVEQDDLLFHTLTVYETLMLAAQLRLPRRFTNEQRKERVEAVLSELNLRKCANTRIGNAKVRGVSGGERKRVSIALEVLRGPQVLFLDECTSGLDSFQALRVIEAIKDLASNGRTIVTSIHQPRSSIYALFDDLILLAEGRLMYFGAARGVVPYFTSLGYEMPKNFNPADFALDIVSIDVRNPALEAESRARFERIVSAMDQHPEKLKLEDKTNGEHGIDENGDAYLLAHGSKYEASYLKQFFLLTQRAFRQKVRDPSASIAPFCVAVFFGIIIGFVYYQNGKNMSQPALQDKAGLLFFIALNQSFNGVLSVITIFPVEKEIVNRERSAKSYSMGPYFFSKVLVDLPMVLVPFTFYLINYWIVGWPANAATFFEGALVVLSGYLCANGIGLICSAVMNSPESAQALATPFVLISALFSGFYANTNLIPAALAWLQWISPIRWIFSGLMVTFVSDMVFECSNAQEEGCVPDGQAYLERLGLSNDSFGRSVGVLLAMWAGFQIIGYSMLTLNKAKWMSPKRAVTPA